MFGLRGGWAVVRSAWLLALSESSSDSSRFRLIQLSSDLIATVLYVTPSLACEGTAGRTTVSTCGVSHFCPTLSSPAFSAGLSGTLSLRLNVLGAGIGLGGATGF